MGLGERLAERMKSADLSQSELARRVNVTPQTIGKLIRGEARGSIHLHRIARELRTSPEYLTGDIDDPTAGAPPILPERDDIIEVPMLDLAYGMGGTFLEDDDPEVRHEPFSTSFIRRYTKAGPEHIVFAEGIGDSMAPTIGTNDLVLIDQSDNHLRMADQIWAFSFGGVGMIKRLRPRPDGSVAILSDNPSVPEDRAVDDELHLIGRVVARVAKL
ncbi:XRE family transcriptional regulator [Novosphingopyxis sp. YJ-S2-01]|nr:S24 family peptidase [Novosphingopyxis sp. YJ-S2-01]MBH9537919.1 helix-turn-helix transcriptional regulator [Novosphingopyxis sp. YJ-S2-01]